MSMQTNCVYGYGFIVYASDEELRNFITKHEETVGKLELGREILSYLENSTPDSFNPKEDFFDYQQLNSSSQGFYGIIADVMSKETGITFEYLAGQEDDDDAIAFCQTYPWNFNEKEKILTEDDLEKICKEYIADLGGQLKPDHIRMEYFG